MMYELSTSSLEPQAASLVLAAWRPLLDPLDLHHPWHAIALLVPLVVAIAVVYKALKLPSLQRLVGETARLSFYIVALMAMAAAILWFVVEIV